MITVRFPFDYSFVIPHCMWSHGATPSAAVRGAWAAWLRESSRVHPNEKAKPSSQSHPGRRVSNRLHVLACHAPQVQITGSSGVVRADCALQVLPPGHSASARGGSSLCISMFVRSGAGSGVGHTSKTHRAHMHASRHEITSSPSSRAASHPPVEYRAPLSRPKRPSASCPHTPWPWP